MNNINNILVNTRFILKMITDNHWRKNVILSNQNSICCDNYTVTKYYILIVIIKSYNRTIKCKMIIISTLHYQIVMSFKTTEFI